MSQGLVRTPHKSPVIVNGSSNTTNPFDDPDLENTTAKTLKFPTDIPVPTIASLAAPHSPDSSPSSPDSSSSTTTTSESTSTHSTEAALTPIQWTNADLHYLLCLLYPALISQNRLFYTPRLESLSKLPNPIHLQLFIRIPESPIPAEAYSRHAPIGTGRPITRVLLAESELECHHPSAARRSLARNILGSRAVVSAICARYTVLSALYELPLPNLQSVLRGMRAMGQANEAERGVRLWQLQGVVDELCEFDLRLETFLLEAGMEELGSWIKWVEAGLGFGQEEREGWSRIHKGAVGFLREVWAV